VRRVVTITDVTRMRQGRVCLAGVDAQGNSVRPVLPEAGIWEGFLTSLRGQVIRPFSRLDLDLGEPTPDPPHTEDRPFNPWTARWVEQLDDAEGFALLGRILDPSVASIFGTPIVGDHGQYVLRGKGRRSLGTIRPRSIDGVTYEPGEEGDGKTRVQFTDAAGASYRLSVTDLTWRLFCAVKRRGVRDDEDMAERLHRLLARRPCVLRIGLARGWKEHPDRCHLQITCVATRPSYTAGKTHRDWAADLPAQSVMESPPDPTTPG